MTSAVIRSGALLALLGDWRTGSGGGLARSLAERIRLLIIDGRISSGTRLPAERDLAERLGLSRTSVTAAYQHLREAGYACSVRGSGTHTVLPGHAQEEYPGSEPRGVDFSKATLPAVPWLPEASREALEQWSTYLGSDGYDPVGIPELRGAIAERYTRRGLPTRPDQIMVTLGAQHAIALLSRTLIGRGDRAVIESPTYPHAYEALRLAGARLVPVPVGGANGDVSDNAAEVEALTQSFRRTCPAVALLMPDFQNPTGRSLHPEARAALLAAAEREGTVVIADETTAELDIDREYATAPLAVSGRAILIGGVGKTVWGGMRLGWIRAEPDLIRKMLQVRAPGDLGNPVLEQLILVRLMPRMPEILELRRQQLRDGRNLLAGLLAERLPEWTMPTVHGGIAAWVSLGAPVSSSLVLAARAHGLAISAGPRFGIDGAFERFLRIPICATAEDTRYAVQALAAAWNSLSLGAAADLPPVPAGNAAIV